MAFTATVSVGVAECSPLGADALVSALRDAGLAARPVSCDDDLAGLDVVLADARLAPDRLHRLAAGVSRQGERCLLLLVCSQNTRAVLQSTRLLGAVGTFERSRNVGELAEMVRRLATGDSSRVEVECEPQGPSSLTSRELQILDIISYGATNEDVAKALGISPHTVRSHLGNILGKLGVTGRLGAVTAVRRAGLLPQPRSAEG